MLKTCKACSTSKPVEEFYKERRVSDGLTARCKDCIKSDAGKSYEQNREKVKDRQKKNYSSSKNREQKLYRNYGISTEVYDHMLKKQDYKCEICNSKDPKHNSGKFVVDHCHKTGNVRGLLCGECNLMLGKAYDNINTLQNAINYLQQ